MKPSFDPKGIRYELTHNQILTSYRKYCIVVLIIGFSADQKEDWFLLLLLSALEWGFGLLPV